MDTFNNLLVSRNKNKQSIQVVKIIRSETLGRSIAMALVANGHAMTGETIYVPMPDGSHKATIGSMVFYDPEGARLHV